MQPTATVAEDTELVIRSSDDHLQAELDLLHLVVEERVIALRASVAVTEEAFLGLYIPDDFVQSVLRRPRAATATIHPARDRMRRRIDEAIERALDAGVELPLARLWRAFDLDALERAIVLVALAPEIDSRYDTLYGYVQNDASRRRATVDLVLSLVADDAPTRAAARRRLDEGAPLLRHELLHVHAPDADASSLASTVRVSPRVVDFLLASVARDAELPAPFDPVVDMRWLPDEVTAQVAAAMAIDGLVSIEGPPESGRLSLIRQACARAHRDVFAVDVATALRRRDDVDALLRRVRREARLTGGIPYLSNTADLFAPARLPIVRRQLDHLGRELEGPTFVECPAEAPLAMQSAARVHVPMPTPNARTAIWSRTLRDLDVAVDEDLVAAVAHRYALPARAIHLAAHRAAQHLVTRSVEPADAGRVLLEAATDQCHHTLGSLATRVTARPQWSDVILPSHVRARLSEVVATIRTRNLVFEQWGFDRARRNGRGTYALLAGPSGVGKSLSAAAIATELELPLYRINLANIVSKYIGETEKNLARIFDEAARSAAILFFDEADALFGKRSEVKDAHDRYANIEVAYLLQRMEAHDGAVLLASNLRSNMDDAFVRRIHHVVEFPFPDAALRARIFEVHLPEQAPLGDELDITPLARHLELSGGNIRNIVFAAATFAADEHRPIALDHLMLAALRELQKLGKLPAKADVRGVVRLMGGNQP